MITLKTTGMAAGKSAPEPPVRNAASSKPPPPTAMKQPAPAPRSASALIAAAGLPADKLSTSIISFARFFSLPLKPELMASIRRQALAQQPATSATEENTAAMKRAAAEPALTETTAAKNREALSLAAAAAESKGIELHPKGLEAFAAAVDPDWQKRQDSGERERGRRNKNHQQEEENATDKASPITAAGLKEMALNAAEQNPLLAILNRLPGKNSRRWIALPFSFSEGGREFKVSLRILLEADNKASHLAAINVVATKVALDIAETNSTETERSWLFALEAAAACPANKLAVYLQPELPPKAHAPFARELSALLNIPLERISIKKRAESFPCESGCADELLRPVNEAV